jgi:hypothetical protein
LLFNSCLSFATQENILLNFNKIALGKVEEVVCSTHQYGYFFKEDKIFSIQYNLLFEKINSSSDLSWSILPSSKAISQIQALLSLYSGITIFCIFLVVIILSVFISIVHSNLSELSTLSHKAEIVYFICSILSLIAIGQETIFEEFFKIVIFFVGFAIFIFALRLTFNHKSLFVVLKI